MVTSKFRATEGRLEAHLPHDRGLTTTPLQSVDPELRLRLRWVEHDGDAPTTDEHGRVVLASVNGALRMFDLWTEREVVGFTPPSSNCTAVAASPDGMPSARCATSRWPVELTGRNSVRPSTTPSSSASRTSTRRRRP